MVIQFPDLFHFLKMGGYVFYVWLAYGCAFLILLFNILVPFCQHRRHSGLAHRGKRLYTRGTPLKFERF